MIDWIVNRPDSFCKGRAGRLMIKSLSVIFGVLGAYERE